LPLNKIELKIEDDSEKLELICQGKNGYKVKSLTIAYYEIFDKINKTYYIFRSESGNLAYCPSGKFNEKKYESKNLNEINWHIIVRTNTDPVRKNSFQHLAYFRNGKEIPDETMTILEVSRKNDNSKKSYIALPNLLDDFSKMSPPYNEYNTPYYEYNTIEISADDHENCKITKVIPFKNGSVQLNFNENNHVLIDPAKRYNPLSPDSLQNISERVLLRSGQNGEKFRVLVRCFNDSKKGYALYYEYLYPGKSYVEGYFNQWNAIYVLGGLCLILYPVLIGMWVYYFFFQQRH